MLYARCLIGRSYYHLVYVSSAKTSFTASALVSTVRVTTSCNPAIYYLQRSYMSFGLDRSLQYRQCGVDTSADLRNTASPPCRLDCTIIDLQKIRHETFNRSWWHLRKRDGKGSTDLISISNAFVTARAAVSVVIKLPGRIRLEIRMGKAI